MAAPWVFKLGALDLDGSPALDDHVAFGDWFYGHVLDPTYRPEVIRVPSEVPMRWDRWEHWQAGDARWAFEVIDTDELTREETAESVEAWVRRLLARAS